MLTIGLIGGMTCQSSIEYYRIINETVRKELGGVHSAKSIMVSVDFAEIEPLMNAERWNNITEILVNAAKNVENGGGDFVVICTNTMHKLADRIQGFIRIPILNIIDVIAEKIKSTGIKAIGLLGTKFTMEQDFYKRRLIQNHGLRIIIPVTEDRKIIERVISDELSVGDIREFSRNEYWRIINSLADRGAEGIILGCTEIPLLISEKEGKIPLFDSTKIHAIAAVDYALKRD